MSLQLLQNKEEFDAFLNESFNHPVAFFKLSSTCFLSQQLSQEINRFLEVDESLSLRCAGLIVQKSRDLSNAISMTFGVVHESPQVLVFKGGEVTYYQDHEFIFMRRVKKALEYVS